NRLVELMLYRLRDDGDTLSEMLYARTATWNRATQSWLLEDGWLRDFSEGSFERFEERHFPVAETPSYFDEGVRSSSKMTYLELQKYVDDLQQGGFEVEYLQTELYKKLSFPFVSLIMALIGLPFALTMGKKGALYGIAAGAFIGIVYWGAFGVFDVLGSNGLLAPLLAAWGPNILFSSGAAVLISSAQT
ncbi:MAG TPA: LptF/LptG family permease, partial [Acidobacteriota bacterium]|nr:LptF/LptG family permease [Acidobacteriota bacterium]